MDTRLLAYEQASTIAEIAAWANELIGKEVPGSPGYKVVRIVHFQVIKQQDGYAAAILVEVADNPNEPPIALKEEDIVVIEQLTSAIEEAPEEKTTLPEE